MGKLFITVTALSFALQTYPMTTMGFTKNLKKEITEGRLLVNSQRALGQLIKVAVGELNEKKEYEAARSLQFQWDNIYFHLYLQAEGRDIGDHSPLSKWLAEKYDVLELVLGLDIMRATRLIDLKTFNYTPPVVFNPCTFDMDSVTIDRIDEYRNHFSYGEVYTGLVPVTTYWLAYSVTVFGSTGAFVYFAGLIGMASERIMMLFAPRLSDNIFTKLCGD